MQLNVSFKQMNRSESLREYIKEKSNRLGKYFHGKFTITWNLAHERENRVVHCHLTGNHIDYFVEASTEDFHASIDLAIDKIEKQIRRKKEIVKDHLHRRGSRSEEAA